MWQEKKEENDLPELKTVLSYLYNNMKSPYKSTEKTDYIHQKQYWQHENQ